jgi:hypothetical protein
MRRGNPMIDTYTKAVLTIIAAALIALVAERFTGPASAQLGDGCGRSGYKPCYVQIVPEARMFQ